MYTALKLQIMREQDGVPETVEDDEENEDEVEGEKDEEDDEVEEDDYVDEDGEVEEEVVEGDDDSETNEECGKEQFFDFVFEAEKFLDSETETEMKKSYIANIRRFNKVHAIDDDDLHFTDEKMYNITKDLIGCCKNFAKEGSTFYKHCSKRKIIVLTHVAKWLFDRNMTEYFRKNTNPKTMKSIKQLIRPHEKDVRKIANHKVCMHEKRKVLQKAKLGEALTATLENIVKINKKNN